MGTTPLKEFYDGAFRLAIETQTPIKPVLFLDAYRRMPYESIFLMTPGQNRILYLEEIPVEGYAIGDLEKLKEEVYTIMEKKLIEYDAAWRNLQGPLNHGDIRHRVSFTYILCVIFVPQCLCGQNIHIIV